MLYCACHPLNRIFSRSSRLSSCCEQMAVGWLVEESRWVKMLILYPDFTLLTLKNKPITLLWEIWVWDDKNNIIQMFNDYLPSAWLGWKRVVISMFRSFFDWKQLQFFLRSVRSSIFLSERSEFWKLCELLKWLKQLHKRKHFALK